MTFAAQELANSQPFELYLFSTTGSVFTLTSGDEPVNFQGQLYSPTPITRSEIAQTQEFAAGQLLIQIPKSHPLAGLFIAYLPPAPVKVTIFAGHIGDPDVAVVFGGEVASARYADECELTCIPGQAYLKQQIPTLVYQSSCAHVFGDAVLAVAGCAHNYAACAGYSNVANFLGFDLMPTRNPFQGSLV